MSDRELLELAAKATGDFYQHPSHEIPENLPVAFYLNEKRWNPLTDDGDALRLAVKLNIDLTFYPNPQIAEPWVEAATENDASDELLQPDPYAATRRAITRAAAEIAKTMENQNV
jgi:hypothetical protein